MSCPSLTFNGITTENKGGIRLKSQIELPPLKHDVI